MDEQHRPKLRHRARKFVTERPRTQKVTAVAGLALLATAPFGGLKAANEPPPVKHKAEQSFVDGPFRITVLKVLTTPELDLTGFTDLEPDEQVALVQLRVRNISDRVVPQTDLQGVIDLPSADLARGDSGTEPGDPKLFNTVDATDLDHFNPDLTYPVSFIVRQRKGWSATATPVEFSGMEWVDKDPLTVDDNHWRLLTDAQPVARVDAPVDTLAHALAVKAKEKPAEPDS